MSINHFKIEDTFKHNVQDQRLKGFEQLLKNWGQINCDYLNEWGTTFSWFNERAAISSLSAAVVKAGGLMVCEVSARKDKSVGTKVNEESTEKDALNNVGRIDMCFSLNGKQYLCEAKHNWLQLPKKEMVDLKNKFGEQQKLAEVDVGHSSKLFLKGIKEENRNITAFIPEHRFALNFLVPFWNYKYTEEFRFSPNEQIESLQNQLSDMGLDFYGIFSIPQKDRILKSNDTEAFNCIILTGKIIDAK
jgi:hypothetical protein